jgi:glc operon protein GlcG
MLPMLFKTVIALFALGFAGTAGAADLPQKRYLNLAAIKTMVAAAEAEAQKRNVNVTICIMDENANILFLQKADRAGTSTVQFAQRKARHSAIYRQPSKASADRLKGGDFFVLAMPDAFPNQGGLPIRVEGVVIGAIGVSGAASEVDEAIGQSAIDALLKN